MIDPRLKHVVAAARRGSFTAAAHSIGVTQSAVTKSIGEMERQVGYSIFHRTSRDAVLTERGRDFVERATRLLDDARDLLREPGAREDPYAGVLRIGVCPASLDWRLVEPITALINRRPSIRFDISGASFERMAQQLRGGAVDVAALGLIRSVFPPPKGVRLVGVTLSNFMVPRDGVEVDDLLLPRPDGHEAST